MIWPRLFPVALAILAVFGAAPAARADTDDARIAAMPLAVTPAAGGGDTLVMIYSGDGGWAALDRGLAKGFAAAGMPVVGVNSLRYFAVRRTAEGAAADLGAVIERYVAEWGKSRVILVGYSFGADALPAIVPSLPAATRARLRLFALVSVFKVGELQFHPGDWFNHRGHDSYPMAPAIEALRGTPMVCVYGDKERQAACPTFPPDLIKQVSLPGGHHYGGAYGDIVRAILEATP